MNLVVNNPVASLKIIKDTLNSDGVRTMQIIPEVAAECSQIDILLYDNTILDIVIMGSKCDAHSKAIGALCRGMHIDLVILRLSGISVGDTGTSCGDQIAKALKASKRMLPAME